MPAGGAWEVVVDKAVLEVVKYLACTTKPFLQHTNIAERMLTLLDNSTMRDLLVERNHGGLCGMLGCAGTPQYRNNKTAEVKEDSNTDINNKNKRKNMECDVYDGCEEVDEDDGNALNSEEDDPEVTETFRKYEKYREQQSGLMSTVSIKEGEGEKDNITTPFRGLQFLDRFCSPDCAVQFRELLDKLPTSLVYERAEVLNAIAALFPNMSLAALQRLAGAESTVVADIQERKKKQEPEEEKEEVSNSNSNSSSSNHHAIGTVLNTASENVCEVLEGIQGVGCAWERAMRESTVVSSHNNGREPLLSMPLMAYDFFLTISTPKTKFLFAKLCHTNNNNNNANNIHINNHNSVGVKGEGNLYTQCMQSIREKCIESVNQQSLLVETEEAIPCVHPIQQQERLSLFATHIFSANTTAALSRLLLYDELTLLRVWSVWQNDGLLTSLQFPFPLPSAITAGSTSALGVFIAIVMAAAGGICTPQGWSEWQQRDNALEEVLRVLHVTGEEFVACVRALVMDIGSRPLQIWDTQVRNGHVKRITDEDIQSSVLEVVGSNVSTCYITCPADPKKTLGIKLPFLVMIIKNLKRYFSFEVTILDDKGIRRRFRASNYQSTTRVKPFTCTMPMRLDEGWNQIQFNLADFTRRAYGTNYLETLRVQLHANCRVRRLYFSDRLYSEEELPPEFKLFLPISQQQQQQQQQEQQQQSMQQQQQQQQQQKQQMQQQQQVEETTEQDESSEAKQQPPPQPVEAV